MAIYEAVMNFNSPTGAIKNVLHYSTVAVQGDTLQDATNEIELQWNSNCRNRFAAAVTFVSMTWRLNAPGEVGVEYQVPLSPVPGTADENKYAAAEAMIIQKRHLSGARPARGRLYVGGITSNQLNGVGNWDQATVDDVATWVESIRDFNAGTPEINFRMVIVASNPTAPNTQTFTQVDQVAGIVRPATQRRRRRGIGI